MLTLAIPAWNIALRTAAVYLVILIGLRLAGKREIGQMTVFDLVVLLLLANAVQISAFLFSRPTRALDIGALQTLSRLPCRRPTTVTVPSKSSTHWRTGVSRLSCARARPTTIRS
jgi:hypothetical protein